MYFFSACDIVISKINVKCVRNILLMK